MVIQCPACRFSRNVPESAITSGKKYKITCPKCKETFSFSVPDNIEEADAPETDPPAAQSDPGVDSRAVQQPEQKTVQQEESPAETGRASLPTEKEGDDPLPPGAQIFDGNEEQIKEPEEPDPAIPGQEEKSWKPGLLGVLSNFFHRADENAAGVSAPDKDAPQGAPWELPEHYGFIGSLTQTLLGVMFRPREFFTNVRCNLPLIRPTLFFVLMTLYQVLISRIWVMQDLKKLAASVSDPQKLAMAENIMNTLTLPMALVVTPFLALFQAFFLAGIYHLMFRIVQPGKADFATTLRIVCYSAAPFILVIVPIVGSNIASVWFVVATFLGCKYALNIPWTRTLLAMLPLFLLELALVLNLTIFLNT